MRTLALLAQRFHTSLEDLERRPLWQIADLVELAAKE